MATYTRRDWGARASKGGPGNLIPSRVDGIALHWPAMSKPLTSVAAVKTALRGWQDYHMDGQGWSDIGYQVAVDQEGNRYELRGLATQSGANGNTDVNQRFGAALLILAPGEEPSAAMVAEVRNVVADHRRLFPRSTRIVGHGQIRPEGTACPGPAVTRGIRAGVFEPTSSTKPATTAPEETDVNVTDIFNHRIRPGLPRFGDMIVGTFKRSNYAMLHARNAEHGVGELAKLIKTMPGASDELRALADDIAAKVAGEVERLDAEAVADKLEINVKE